MAPVVSRALLRYADEQIGRGLARLVATQDADGLWRDYSLSPGPSESWCTSWIGWHLAWFPRRKACADAVRRSAVALAHIRGPGGWGYNLGTGPDADSTAWTLRLMRQAGICCGRADAASLAQYVDCEGRVHTFHETAYGSWSDAHDDVTPIVGLALLACDRRNDVLKRLRAAVGQAQRADGLWTSFWWASDAYASFWSIYFLRRSGGLTQHAYARVRSGLSDLAARHCALETALWLLLALELKLADPLLEEHLVDSILEASTGEGWVGSPLLLVPARFQGDSALPPGPHADERGLMTTAAVCWALARWCEGQLSQS